MTITGSVRWLWPEWFVDSSTSPDRSDEIDRRGNWSPSDSSSNNVHQRPAGFRSQRLADKLIAQLQEETAPWQKPWFEGQAFGPYNPTIGNRDRGINFLALIFTDRKPFFRTLPVDIGRFGATASVFFTCTIGTARSVPRAVRSKTCELIKYDPETFRESIGRISRVTIGRSIPQPRATTD